MTEENKEEEVSVGVDEHLPAVVEQTVFAEAELMPDEVEEVVEVVEVEETEADVVLVETAVIKIANMYITNHNHNITTMLGIGEYLIKEFYGNNPNRAKLKKEAVKEESLKSVIKQLRLKGEDTPSKSWLYNTINLAVDHKSLEGVHSYGLLPISSKILLLPLKDDTLKTKLADEAINNKLSVGAFRKIVNEHKDPKKRGIKRSIKDEAYILSHKVDDIFTQFKNEIDDLSKTGLNSLKKAVEFEVKKLKKLVENKTSMLDKYKEIKLKIDAVPVKENVKSKKSKDKSE